jgi:capsular exopolysaccharide synthesis family protein
MTWRDEGWGGFGEARSDDQGALKRYLDTIRERKWIVIVAVVLCTLAATAYALTAHNVYTASADILVTPVPSDQTSILGLGLLRQASDPTQDETTASELVDNAAVAAQVQQNLGWRESPAALLRQVSVQPVANSSIVAITASTGSPARSVQLANAFAHAAIQVRTEQLHQELAPAIQSMRQQIQQVTGNAPAGIGESPLYQGLFQMQQLLSEPDPTLQFVTPATLPTGPASPNRKLDITGGVLAGLLIGIAGAFALKALDPRRAREAGLGATGLPVLTRVPRLGRSGRARHAFDEAFRSLRTTLRFAASDTPVSTVAVTSASEKEGKTTTSFQLAMAALEAGQSVLLVDTDPFRPGLRSLIEPFGGETSGAGLLEYLAGTAGLDDIIERTTVPDLMFVPAGSRQATSFTRLLEGERGRAFVGHLSGLADLVILDCPPVGPRSDAVLIASEAEAVLMVVDLQRSDENDVLDTLRRLRRAGAHLLGIVLNYDTSAGAVYDYDPGKGSGLARTLSPRH